MNEILERFVEWVNRNGGPTPVATAIGKTPQSFYNYANRGSKPNMDILALLANRFPNFDIGYILTGIKTAQDESELAKKVNELESEKSLLESMYSKALLEVKKAKGEKVNFKPGVSQHPLVDKEGASEMLSKSIRLRIGSTNMSLLNISSLLNRNN